MERGSGGKPWRQKVRHVEIFLYFVVFKVNILIFTRPGPRDPRGLFLFSQLEMCAVLERGALGSLGWVKNGVQERCFECFFRGVILDSVFIRC